MVFYFYCCSWNIGQFKFKDGCSVCCKDISAVNDPDWKELYDKELKKSKLKLLDIIKDNLLPESHIFYSESSGLQKFISELIHYLRHKSIVSWFYDNQYYHSFIDMLKKCGMDGKDAEKMVKDIQINRSTNRSTK